MGEGENVRTLEIDLNEPRQSTTYKHKLPACSLCLAQLLKRSCCGEKQYGRIYKLIQVGHYYRRASFGT